MVQVLDLLPDADNNIERLRGVVEGSAKRMVATATKWESRRVELIKELRGLRRAQEDAEGVAQGFLEEIKVIRAEMKVIADEAKTKETALKHLSAEYEKMPKDTGRAAFTRKILEIVKNIRKQSDEISKVLQDTRIIQKELNTVSDKLNRTYTMTDELIFKDAKTDETCRAAYKLLANIHSNCSQLVEVVEETATVTREARELEEQIEQEQTKKMEANASRITSDLMAIKKENSTLIAKVKAAM